MIQWPIQIKQNKYTKWYEQIIANAQLRNFPLSRWMHLKQFPNLYTEVHHIVPRSLSGSNSKDNLVRLTCREHFVCHWLLTKMVEGEYRTKMIYALHFLKGNNRKTRYSTKITSRVYEQIRLRVIETNRKNNTGKKRTVETRKRISDSLKGKMSWDKLFSPEEAAIRKAKRSEETRKRLTGNKPSPETIAKISLANKGRTAPNKGIPATEEQRKNTSTAQLARLNALRKAGLPMPNTGRIVSNETRKKMSIALTGRVQTDEHRLKNSIANSGENNGMFGRKHSDNAKKIQSEKAKLRIKQECIYCKKLVDPSNYTRWHGDNCKEKSIKCQTT
jgi:hypothetical protein